LIRRITAGLGFELVSLRLEVFARRPGGRLHADAPDAE
jgi:hypothetical protein